MCVCVCVRARFVFRLIRKQIGALWEVYENECTFVIFFFFCFFGGFFESHDGCCCPAFFLSSGGLRWRWRERGVVCCGSEAYIYTRDVVYSRERAKEKEKRKTYKNSNHRATSLSVNLNIKYRKPSLEDSPGFAN